MPLEDQPDSSAIAEATAAEAAQLEAELADATGAATTTGIDSTDESAAVAAAEADATAMLTSDEADSVMTSATAAEPSSQAQAPMVVSVNSAPTASETEAANILTTIKSGELLSLQNADLLAASGSDNIM